MMIINYDRILQLQSEEQAGAFFSTLQKGDTWVMNKNTYLVQSVSKKQIRVMETDAKGAVKPLTFKIFNSQVLYGNFQAEQFFRDLDGHIMLDLINEYNPFHEPGFVLCRIWESLRLTNSNCPSQHHPTIFILEEKILRTHIHSK